MDPGARLFPDAPGPIGRNQGLGGRWFRSAAVSSSLFRPAGGSNEDARGKRTRPLHSEPKSPGTGTRFVERIVTSNRRVDSNGSSG